MHKYKSIEYANETASRFADTAMDVFLKSMANLPPSSAKENIKRAISFVIERER